MNININRNLVEEINIPNRYTLQAFFAPVFTLAILIIFIPYLFRERSIHTTIIVFCVVLAPVLVARLIDRIIDHHVLIIDWCLTILILVVGVPTAGASGLVGIIIVFFFPRTIYFCVWSVSAITLFMLGVRLTFDGKISKREQIAFALEHKGFIDYFIALYLMGYKHKYKIVYGTNLEKYFGRYARMVGIGVDRKRLRSKAEAQKAVDQAIKDGFRIIFFPEGTRMRLVQVLEILLPFRKGILNSIFENELPIQMVNIDCALAYSAPDKMFPLSPGEIKISFSDEIETAGKNKEELFSKLHSNMKAKTAQSIKMQELIAKSWHLAA